MNKGAITIPIHQSDEHPISHKSTFSMCQLVNWSTCCTNNVLVDGLDFMEQEKVQLAASPEDEDLRTTINVNAYEI